ncbi:cyclin-like protein [Punctularia strigosozonata HHB-11173 SS5]|uniref:cyclin-like protein n=1 Tax=Punctularia strigosozonata (strain HHB-11173) TaxID=741275 RepID=UPI00044163EF|nr:cyclin-like protein [Punctularia strigosozonata HHB-11173 SS5]EIN10033.1 cyclin-like protein [Punctularia strigosozonata HHB-11173 SS5]
MGTTVCAECGGSVIEYDAAAGNGFCVACGTVVEENTIVSEVTFGETSSGAAMVQGSYVAQGATRARMGGFFGNRGGDGESREQTIANASRKIQSVAGILRLSESICHAATRLYTLAVEHKFTKGRKSMNVVAVCLYVACRQKETRNYMLIDFSDLLQASVNVFELGHTYLQLVQTLNLRLPLVDPSHYISRFAALLEFGEETHQVATDAVRLVQRFDRDWMTRGRRPAGICGAALLLAARMNNFRRSIEEIVQVVKIADVTLRKRMEEFRKTPSGELTLADFRTVWLEEEVDPPAYTKGREKEKKERDEREREECGELAEGQEKTAKATKRKKKRKRGEDEEQGQPAGNDGREGEQELTLAEELNSFLGNAQSTSLAEALSEAEQRRRAQLTVVDELQGLDEEELDQFIMTEEEVKIRERVWVELNKDYLEAIAGTYSIRRKANNKPRDASTPHGSTAAESARNLVKKNPKFSKRINYDALKDLFIDEDNKLDIAFAEGRENDNLYTMPGEEDAEGMEVVEEEGGGVGMAQVGKSKRAPGRLEEGNPSTTLGTDGGAAGDYDAEGDETEGLAEGVWEDAYEQEV